jgi:hypothetical protein
MSYLIDHLYTLLKKEQIMPQCLISGIPPDTSEEKFVHVASKVEQIMMGIEELGIKDRTGITCNFPPDMWKNRPTTQILMKVEGLFDKPERTDMVRQRLAKELEQGVRELFPGAELVQCFICPFDPAKGFSESRKKSVPEGEQVPA